MGVARWVVIPALCALAMWTAACGGSASSGNATPKEDAGAAVKRQLFLAAEGKYGQLWDELHPAQQAVVPKQKYIECTAQKSPPFQLDDVNVVDTRDDPIDFATLPDKRGAKLVLFSLVIGPARTTSGRQALRVVPVKGQWRWILPDSVIAKFKEGTCPS